MPQTWVRRLRGIAVSMALWAIPWSIVGLVVGVLMMRSDYAPPRLPLILAGLGAGVGVVNGFTFAVLLSVLERNRSIETLPTWRMGIWGALTTGALGWLVFRDVAPALACAAAGYGASAVSLWVARRGVSSAAE